METFLQNNQKNQNQIKQQYNNYKPTDNDIKQLFKKSIPKKFENFGPILNSDDNGQTFIISLVQKNNADPETQYNQPNICNIKQLPKYLSDYFKSGQISRQNLQKTMEFFQKQNNTQIIQQIRFQLNKKCYANIDVPMKNFNIQNDPNIPLEIYLQNLEEEHQKYYYLKQAFQENGSIQATEEECQKLNIQMANLNCNNNNNIIQQEQPQIIKKISNSVDFSDDDQTNTEIQKSNNQKIIVQQNNVNQLRKNSIQDKNVQQNKSNNINNNNNLQNNSNSNFTNTINDNKIQNQNKNIPQAQQQQQQKQLPQNKNNTTNNINTKNQITKKVNTQVIQSAPEKAQLLTSQIDKFETVKQKSQHILNFYKENKFKNYQKDFKINPDQVSNQNYQQIITQLIKLNFRILPKDEMQLDTEDINIDKTIYFKGIFKLHQIPILEAFSTTKKIAKNLVSKYFILEVFPEILSKLNLTKSKLEQELNDIKNEIKQAEEEKNRIDFEFEDNQNQEESNGINLFKQFDNHNNSFDLNDNQDSFSLNNQPTSSNNNNYNNNNPINNNLQDLLEQNNEEAHFSDEFNDFNKHQLILSPEQIQQEQEKKEEQERLRIQQELEQKQQEERKNALKNLHIDFTKQVYQVKPNDMDSTNNKNQENNNNNDQNNNMDTEDIVSKDQTLKQLKKIQRFFERNLDLTLEQIINKFQNQKEEKLQKINQNLLLILKISEKLLYFEVITKIIVNSVGIDICTTNFQKKKIFHQSSYKSNESRDKIQYYLKTLNEMYKEHQKQLFLMEKSQKRLKPKNQSTILNRKDMKCYPPNHEQYLNEWEKQYQEPTLGALINLLIIEKDNELLLQQEKQENTIPLVTRDDAFIVHSDVEYDEKKKQKLKKQKQKEEQEEKERLRQQLIEYQPKQKKKQDIKDKDKKNPKDQKLIKENSKKNDCDISQDNINTKRKRPTKLRSTGISFENKKSFKEDLMEEEEEEEEEEEQKHKIIKKKVKTDNNIKKLKKQQKNNHISSSEYSDDSENQVTQKQKNIQKKTKQPKEPECICISSD